MARGAGKGMGVVMIKRILCSFVFVLLVVQGVMAVDRIEYSALQTGDALIISGRAEFHGITITGDGTNAVTVDIYNNIEKSGEKITPTLNFSQSATSKTQAYSVNPPVRCNTGIYVDITTSGTASYVIYFSRY